MNTQTTKAAVTVAEMARMCGLGRSRFYQLIGTAFPHPVYSVSTKRPFYDEDQQKVCLEVRRRNSGIDGKPILFYAKPINRVVPVKSKKSSAIVPVGVDAELIDGLRSLGLSTTPKHVADAVRFLFPSGADHVDSSSLLRQVFIHMKSQEGR